MKQTRKSQSLRKSGLCRPTFSTDLWRQITVGRNPFVNQVFVVAQRARQLRADRARRNPFVNQVFVV